MFRYTKRFYLQVLHELLRQREDELALVKQELESTLQSDKPIAANEQLEQLQQIVLEKTAHLEQKEKYVCLKALS